MMSFLWSLSPTIICRHSSGNDRKRASLGLFDGWICVSKMKRETQTANDGRRVCVCDNSRAIRFSVCAYRKLLPVFSLVNGRLTYLLVLSLALSFASAVVRLLRAELDGQFYLSFIIGQSRKSATSVFNCRSSLLLFIIHPFLGSH